MDSISAPAAAAPISNPTLADFWEVIKGWDINKGFSSFAWCLSAWLVVTTLIRGWITYLLWCHPRVVGVPLSQALPNLDVWYAAGVYFMAIPFFVGIVYIALWVFMVNAPTWHRRRQAGVKGEADLLVPTALWVLMWVLAGFAFWGLAMQFGFYFL